MSLRDHTATVLSLQNTVSKEDQLAAWAGADRVIGASTIEGGTLIEPGVVRHTATAPTTAYFGELDGSDSARVAAIVDAFVAAGFASKAVDDIRHVEWEKLLQISVVASWSASTLGGRVSLHDDLLRGRSTELDHSVGAYLAQADRLGLPAPTVRAAYRIAKAQEHWLVQLGGVTPVL